MQFTIEKMVYGGDGLARLPADEQGRGKAVFIPFVAPGEFVEAEITEQRPGFARAELVKVLQPVRERVEPRCPYFGRCGGCHYQHIDYRRQLEIKREILLETMQRTAKLRLDCDVQVHASEPYEYRNRTRLKVQASPEFAIGYHRTGTNELLPVKKCPISSPLIQRAIAAMWQVGSGGTDCEGLREVQLFADQDDARLLVEFYTDRGVSADSLADCAEALRAAVPEIVGVSVFSWALGGEDEEDHAPLTVSRLDGDAVTFGAGELTYNAAGKTFGVRAGSFFQTNRFLIDELVSAAIGDAQGHTALDLYAGTGLFSVPLAQRFERVIAVEASPFSFRDLQRNVPDNVKAVQSTTERYVENVGQKSGLEFVLLDPPRSGMGERTSRTLGQLRVPRLTYVSCDPATLARDVKVLAAAGFRVNEAHLFDLFPQTFHMETVLRLER